MAGRKKRALLALFAVSGVVVGTDARAAGNPAPSETSVIAQRLWGKLLTRCGETAYYAGSPFDASGILANVQVGHTKLIEYRGLRFNAVPIPISPAERLNGISARARITMIAQVYREDGGRWQDGLGLQPRNTDDIFAKVLRSSNADLFEFGTSGVMALEIVKHEGRWSAARTGATGGAVGLSSSYYLVDEVIAAPAARYNCQTGKVIPRPPTPEEAAKLAEDAKRKAEEERQARLQAEVDAVRREEEQRDRAERAAYLAEIDRKMLPWRFEGAFGPFTAKLTSNLIKRGQQYGFNPMDYAEEVAAINRLIEPCFQYTAADWNAAQAFRGSVKAKHEMLQNCDGWIKVRVSPAGKPHGLTVMRSLSDYQDNKIVWAGRLQVLIDIDPTQEDYDKAGQPPMTERGPAFRVIDARLPVPVKTAGARQ